MTWSAEKLPIAVDLFRQGNTIADIADTLETDRGRLSRHLRRHLGDEVFYALRFRARSAYEHRKAQRWKVRYAARRMHPVFVRAWGRELRGVLRGS